MPLSTISKLPVQTVVSSLSGQYLAMAAGLPDGRLFAFFCYTFQLRGANVRHILYPQGKVCQTKAGSVMFVLESLAASTPTSAGFPPQCAREWPEKHFTVEAIGKFALPEFVSEFNESSIFNYLPQGLFEMSINKCKIVNKQFTVHRCY